MQQKDALLLWTAINKLSLQVSVIKEEFARMMNGYSQVETKTQQTGSPNSRYLVRPPGMKQQ